MVDKIDRDLPLKKEISQNIKRLMKERGWTQLKVSELSGISKSTLSDYVNCRTLINPGNVERLSETFGVHKYDIDPSFKRTDIIEEAPVNHQVKSNTINIPLYGSIAAGALATVDHVTKDKVEYLPVPNQILGKHSKNKNLFAMKVNGDSMNKIIPHGALVVCKPVECCEVKNEDIIIFSHDSEYSMKRVRCDEEDKVLVFSPESYNKKFRDIVIPFNTTNDLKIYAKVIWYSVVLD
ncbi:LexA family protein [Pseudobacillus badius]|uniref:LexA family protein n=1 Tax=Bacillus badius TaxID=1455 RepID=UPI0024A1DA13|nr:LexA family transcriptional regulator [Bacillus badius]GLY09565.1 helix-turn-helix transcriptional regulator [Bacillus badius]